MTTTCKTTALLSLFLPSPLATPLFSCLYVAFVLVHFMKAQHVRLYACCRFADGGGERLRVPFSPILDERRASS
jgi:hypothetical protein